MAAATACVGLSLSDFYSLTPSEFRHIWMAWSKSKIKEEHSAWERVRFSALCALQPYSKKKLKPSDVVRFPWEEGAIKNEKPPVEESTRERFETIKKLWG